MVQGLPLSPQPPALPGWWFHLHFGEGKSIFHKEESLTQTLPWLPASERFSGRPGSPGGGVSLTPRARLRDTADTAPAMCHGAR